MEPTLTNLLNFVKEQYRLARVTGSPKQAVKTAVLAAAEEFGEAKTKKQADKKQESTLTTD